MFNASDRDGSPRGPLPKMSDDPTLLEFFEKRFAPANHVLQSATRALKTGMPEEIILACLMHDTVHALVKVDHGWWGAQIIEPYVSEKVTFAIRHHQTLRFYPDEKFGYEYPEMYLRMFGEDYKPEPYLEQNYKMVRNHKWYELPRLVTVNDLYSFDPNAKVSIEPFIDIIGRHFKQPKEGLGYDNSPWRTCGARSCSRIGRSRCRADARWQASSHCAASRLSRRTRLRRAWLCAACAARRAAGGRRPTKGLEVQVAASRATNVSLTDCPPGANTCAASSSRRHDRVRLGEGRLQGHARVQARAARQAGAH